MKKIRPIIKWTGGKYDEFPEFSDHLPHFDNYYEPFFGGGGTFFALQPTGAAFLNDKSSDLVDFYRSLNNPLFMQEATRYADAWDQITVIARQLTPDLTILYQQFLSGSHSLQEMKLVVTALLTTALQHNQNLLNDPSFIVFPGKFFDRLVASVTDKCRRLLNLTKKGNAFLAKELPDHIETGIKSGFYLYLRELTNLQFAGRLQMSTEKAVANWYFVREFCYASMFRYSSKGNFNIPYGGIAYNRKNFRQKVENLFVPEVKALFSNASLYNLDFEVFLRETTPTENDFIFLDPPYDSEFSEYDKNVFSKSDQLRLRDAVVGINAKWMLVIKETDYIRSLYSVPGCRFIEFDKTYTYNVRGRNNRETRHLIIVNYDEPKNDTRYLAPVK